ncbi:hypothetical protein [Suttonella ornithocola]|uniref:Uncharacterized protein n=1 Tax=Suttonella ornithocola TaxID=279832 RepID=A0A380MUS9_9GAMM|nr:hypothetical protein [Suttonella ornithocola]SUO95461.1 Uncharacterised protein [Suttonella ornithocola]
MLTLFIYLNAVTILVAFHYNHYFYAQTLSKNKIIQQAKTSTVKKYTAKSSIVIDAETSATPAERSILRTIRKMAQSGEIIRGGCWDYLNIAWNRAGYPHTRRQNIFTGSYPNGPFADTNFIQVGDWLYHIDHSYHDIEHSGLFIVWINQEKKRSLDV